MDAERNERDSKADQKQRSERPKSLFIQSLPDRNKRLLMSFAGNAYFVWHASDSPLLVKLVHLED